MGELAPALTAERSGSDLPLAWGTETRGLRNAVLDVCTWALCQRGWLRRLKGLPLPMPRACAHEGGGDVSSCVALLSTKGWMWKGAVSSILAARANIGEVKMLTRGGAVALLVKVSAVGSSSMPGAGGSEGEVVLCRGVLGGAAVAVSWFPFSAEVLKLLPNIISTAVRIRCAGGQGPGAPSSSASGMVHGSMRHGS
jgi:hypothetical protein